MTIQHDFGTLNCGLCYPKEKVLLLGINDNLVELDYEQL